LSERNLKRNLMRPLFKIVLISLALLMSNGALLLAQPDRIGAGLSFANVLDFNTGETSNPGFLIKTWIALDKKKKMHIVPTITAYNTYKFDPGTYILTNYMFQGDLDVQYVVFHEKTVKVIGFVGGNYTYLYSTYEEIIASANNTITDASDGAFGGNLGTALELRMSDHWDFVVSGKYKMSKYPQFVISVNAAYFFKSRGRQYRSRGRR
jgi:hypothetical protein